jgi:hypothetical protein
VEIVPGGRYAAQRQTGTARSSRSSQESDSPGVDQ